MAIDGWGQNTVGCVDVVKSMLDKQGDYVNFNPALDLPIRAPQSVESPLQTLLIDRTVMLLMASARNHPADDKATMHTGAEFVRLFGPQGEAPRLR